MEKWNSTKARELGINPDLLQAVNSVVKAGRKELSRLADIEKFRASLHSGQSILFNMLRHRHGALFVSDDILTECGFFGDGLIIATNATEVLEAMAKANRLNFDANFNESGQKDMLLEKERFTKGMCWGNLFKADGVLEHLINAEAHESMGGFRMEPISVDQYKKGLQEIKEDLGDLRPFILKTGSPEWHEAFDRIFSPQSCSVSRIQLTWDFIVALNPSLAKEPHIKKMLRALLI